MSSGQESLASDRGGSCISTDPITVVGTGCAPVASAGSCAIGPVGTDPSGLRNPTNHMETGPPGLPSSVSLGHGSAGSGPDGQDTAPVGILL